MTNALLAFIVFLLLAQRWGELAAVGGLAIGAVAYVIIGFATPIVGWWIECAAAAIRPYLPLTKSDNRDAP